MGKHDILFKGFPVCCHGEVKEGFHNIRNLVKGLCEFAWPLASLDCIFIFFYPWQLYASMATSQTSCAQSRGLAHICRRALKLKHKYTKRKEESGNFCYIYYTLLHLLSTFKKWHFKHFFFKQPKEWSRVDFAEWSSPFAPRRKWTESMTFQRGD